VSGTRRPIGPGRLRSSWRHAFSPAIVRCSLSTWCSVCLFACSPCGSSAGSTLAWRATSTQVQLLPELTGGVAGWCITDAPGMGCPVSETFRGPIVAESWLGYGPPVRTEGFALTTGDVAAVSVEGGPAIPTRGAPELPGGLREVVVRAPGRIVGAFPHFTALDAAGRTLMGAGKAGVPTSVTSPGKPWARPQREPRGICELKSTRLGGLVATAGFVVSRAVPFTGVGGRSFLSCASNSYTFDGWPLVGSVLVDGARPTAPPAALPGMKSIPHSRGLFDAVGANGTMVARRIPGAWLVVSGGRAEQQRLAVVAHLRATLHLSR
jgi:hypothetical protein